MLRVIINGALGRMGRTLREMCAERANIEIVAGADIAPGACECPLFRSIADCDIEADVAIDFTRPDSPDARPDLVRYARRTGCALVIATTGMTQADQQLIADAARDVAIFKAANFSIGVNLLEHLAQKAAQFLGNGFDIEIVEKHHNQKIDAPSGTALALADAISAATPEPRPYTLGRHGADAKREAGEIGIHAVRGGSIVGEHEVSFIGQYEVISLSHSALSRQVFAAGALRAAAFIAGKSPGLYGMRDMLEE